MNPGNVGKFESKSSPTENETVLAWTKQQLAQLADTLSRRLDQAVSIDESPEQAKTSRRPNVVFLGSGFSKYLASGVDQLPPGWSCNWRELVESVEGELNEEQRKLYDEIVANHQDNNEYKL